MTKDTVGSAVAGKRTVVCRAMPMMMCNPVEDYSAAECGGRSPMFSGAGLGHVLEPGDPGRLPGRQSRCQAAAVAVPVPGSQRRPRHSGKLRLAGAGQPRPRHGRAARRDGPPPTCRPASSSTGRRSTRPPTPASRQAGGGGSERAVRRLRRSAASDRLGGHQRRQHAPGGTNTSIRRRPTSPRATSCRTTAMSAMRVRPTPRTCATAACRRTAASRPTLVRMSGAIPAWTTASAAGSAKATGTRCGIFAANHYARVFADGGGAPADVERGPDRRSGKPAW